METPKAAHENRSIRLSGYICNISAHCDGTNHDETSLMFSEQTYYVSLNYSIHPFLFGHILLTLYKSEQSNLHSNNNNES